jgi:hypothetical protein
MLSPVLSAGGAACAPSSMMIPVSKRPNRYWPANDGSDGSRTR